MVEPTQEAEDYWNATCRQLANKTLFAKTESRIFGANIPGKPHTVPFYMGGLAPYRKMLADVTRTDYAGFFPPRGAHGLHRTSRSGRVKRHEGTKRQAAPARSNRRPLATPTPIGAKAPDVKHRRDGARPPRRTRTSQRPAALRQSAPGRRRDGQSPLTQRIDSCFWAAMRSCTPGLVERRNFPKSSPPTRWPGQPRPWGSSSVDHGGRGRSSAGRRRCPSLHSSYSGGKLGTL